MRQLPRSTAICMCGTCRSTRELASLDVNERIGSGRTGRRPASPWIDVGSLGSRSVVLHVGAHKTGTSLIQKYFRDRPEQLDPGAVTAIDRSEMKGLIGVWGHVVVDRPRVLRR